MSRAQGDGFRTHTDHELNAYKWRLRNKLVKLIDHKEKWYRVGAGWILAEERNRMVNPNGSWRWNGWVVKAHEYWITVFPEECVEIREGKPVAIGWSVARKVIDDDKEAANRYFKETALPLARGLKTWIPTELDNRPAFEYEGRRPQAGIKIEWEDDEYEFVLVVDGEEKKRGKEIAELKKEAERIGAELQESHKP